METPLFSVLIANYNNGPYLKEAIESVLAQSYSNWEVVIVDDASTDNSLEIYKEYASDPRFYVYHNDVNCGCGFTKRRCVESAHGELCGFLDPDDALMPKAIEEMVGCHKIHPNAACVFSRFYRCDERLVPQTESRLLEIPEGEDYFTHRDYSPEHFATFKRAAYLQTGGIDPTLKMAVDQDLYFRLEEVGQVVVLDRLTYKYRQHLGGISRMSDGDRSFYWNLIVRNNTCYRRGLDPMSYPFKDFCGFVRHHERVSAYQSKVQTEREVRGTKAYRLGRLLLSPFKIIVKGKK